MIRKLANGLDANFQYDGVIGDRIINAKGEVTGEDASLDLVAEVTSGLWLEGYPYVQKLMFSVYKTSVGGNGICEVKSIRDGEVLWTVGTDTIKDVPVDWGMNGIKASAHKADGLQVVVSGADTQASVYVAVEGYYRHDKEAG